MLNWLPFVLHSVISAGSTPAISSNSVLAEGCEFGDIYATTPAVCDIRFSNTGERPVRIGGFHVANNAVTAEPAELIVAPHSTGQVRIQIDTSKAVGRQNYVVSFNSYPKVDQQGVKVQGYVLTALDQRAPSVDLGVVNLSSPLIEREIELSSHEVDNFRITRVISAPQWISAKITDSGRILNISVKSDAPWGVHEEYVRIGMNTMRQPEAVVKVRADIHGDVVPSVNPLDFGVVRTGTRNEALIRFNSISRKKVRLGNIKIEGFQGRAKIMNCQPKADDCAMVRVTVSDKQAIGSLKGTLWVDLPDYAKQLPVMTWGLLLPKGMRIPKIEDMHSQSETSLPNSDVAVALKALSSNAVDLPPPPGSGPLLKWSVAQAGTVYGFQIFRSKSENGPFLLLNHLPIHSDVGNEETQVFQWRDNDVQSGSTYYYSIGILRVNGKKEHLAGPQKVTAK